LEHDGRPVIQVDGVDIGLGGQSRRIDVEDPLLRAGIPAKRGVWSSGRDGLINVGYSAADNLHQHEATHDPGSSNGSSIGVTDAELCGDGAALLPNGRAVGIDGLENLVTSVAVADSAAGVKDLQCAGHIADAVVGRGLSRAGNGIAADIARRRWRWLCRSMCQ